MLPNVRSRTCARIWAFLLATVPAACFNPDRSITGGDDTTSGEVCTPSTTEACTCAGGESGTRTCLADGTGFGACECEGTDAETTDTVTDSADSTTVVPECTVDSDCVALDEECIAGVCDDAGQCVAEPRSRGEACGSAASSECDAADSCDGAGRCVDGIAPVGLPCGECESDVCACDGGGACEVCPAFVTANDFATPRAIAGWMLSGGWGLYAAAPQSSLPSVPFPSMVFGTDGNRRHPYPLVEDESSAAVSRPFVLPASLTFASWHVDEGGFGCAPDGKTVSASIDGGTTWIPLSDCCMPGLDTAPYCQFQAGPRLGDAFDPVELPVPAALVGQLGQIRFTYATLDACCGFEQGWFIDASNLGTECECGTDQTCAPATSDCGTGVCGADGQCGVDAVAMGQMCGDDAVSDCSAADACNAFGLCEPQHLANGPATCSECPSGICGGCVDGECVDCPSDEYEVFSFAGWVAMPLGGTASPGWGSYTQAPPNNLGTPATPFGARSPVIGTDGNRLAPYPNPNGHAETSQWITAEFTVPAAITFESWNQDEGGPNGPDTKVIELSVDGGATWIPLADCSVDALPFCVYTDTRPIDAWDPVSLDTAAWEGMTGQLRFGYNTGDACCDFERGWFINDLNVLTRCIDPIPAP